MVESDVHHFLMGVIQDGESFFGQYAVVAVATAFGNAGGSGIEKIDSVFIYFGAFEMCGVRVKPER